jgi:hypothetical protein
MLLLPATALLAAVLLPMVVVGVRLLLPIVVLAEVVREGEGAAREGVERPGVPKQRQQRQMQQARRQQAHIISYRYGMYKLLSRVKVAKGGSRNCNKTSLLQPEQLLTSLTIMCQNRR